MSIIAMIHPGASEFDENRRIQGALDLPLSPSGGEQLALLAERLRDVPLECLYAGDAEPSRASAEVLSELLGVPLRILDDLVNQNLGLWQGLQLEELRRKQPRTWKQYEESPDSVCPPGGETVQNVRDRLSQVLARPLKSHDVFGVVLPEPAAAIARGWLLNADEMVCPMLNDDACGNLEYINTETRVVGTEFEVVAEMASVRRNGRA
jgi:broad specificity phosphatase PhoE